MEVISMKKYISIILAAVMIMCCLSGCGSSDGTTKESDGKLSIVTTIFPEYDWVMNILGDNPAGAEVTMLLDKGVDLHNFQPTAADILKVASCDMFIYVGGESDGWVEDALKESVNKDMIVINLLDVLGDAVKEEELVEGMQEEDEHDHDHDHDEDEDHDHDEDHDQDEDHDHEEGPEYDEHVWLSLRDAAKLTETISANICKMDSANEAVYKANTDSYIEKLNALDAQYSEAVSNASVKTILFGDRFPFRYLTDDYGLDYYAAFVGCSAETEASFETITFLADKVDELSLGTVMTIEKSDKKIAETIIQNTGSKDQNILTLDSMQSVTAEDVKNGTTYLSVMESNLEVLKEALK